VPGFSQGHLVGEKSRSERGGAANRGVTGAVRAGRSKRREGKPEVDVEERPGSVPRGRQESEALSGSEGGDRSGVVQGETDSSDGLKPQEHEARYKRFGATGILSGVLQSTLSGLCPRFSLEHSG
jgi:hypothetical protein